MVDVCAVDDATREHLARTYRELHEGLELDKFVCERVQKPLAPMRRLGWATEIQYAKAVPEGTPSYWHPWERHAQPELWIDARGKLYVRGATYTVTTRGIEDLGPGGRTARTHLDLPRRLVTLGKLEWIKYRGADGANRILRFVRSAQPVVAHDEIGKLHFLRGSYRVRTDQQESKMAHRRRRRYSSARRAVRANPSGFYGASMGVAKMAAMVGGAVLISGYALNKLVSYVPATGQYAGYVRAASMVAAGIAGPVLLKGKLPPDLLNGWAIAGVAGGGMAAYEAYRASLPSARGSLPPGPTVPPGSIFDYGTTRARAVAGVRR